MVRCLGMLLLVGCWASPVCSQALVIPDPCLRDVCFFPPPGRWNQRITGPTELDGRLRTSSLIIGNWTEPGQFHLMRGRLEFEADLGVQQGELRVSDGQLTAEHINLISMLEQVLLTEPTPPRILQTGGTIEARQQLTLAAGTYELQAGQLDAPLLYMNGRQSERGFWQTGGVVTLSEALRINDGTYHLTDGTLSTTTLAMGDPATSGFSATRNREPAFIQEDGHVNVQGSLELCVPGFSPEPVLVEILPPFASVRYEMHGGVLDIGADLIVGSMGLAPAEFLHTAGETDVAGTLRIEGDASVLDLQGGQLTAGKLHVATDVFNEGGLLRLHEAGGMTITDEVIWGETARLETSGDVALRLTGTSWEMRAGSAMQMLGLNTLTLIVDQAKDVLFEVASLHEGPLLGELDGNFALGRLQIGETQSTTLRLVDLIDNQPGTAGSEVLYVEELELLPGSVLDTNGLGLFYRSLVLGEGAQILGGATAIPEPATWWLLLMGVALGHQRRGKRRYS